MFELKQYCRPCGKPKPHLHSEQWWTLNNYFNLSGLFCDDCYEKISHDSYGKPNYPGEYLMVLMKFGMMK